MALANTYGIEEMLVQMIDVYKGPVFLLVAVRHKIVRLWRSAQARLLVVASECRIGVIARVDSSSAMVSCTPRSRYACLRSFPMPR